MTRSIEPILVRSEPQTAVPSTLWLPIRLPCSRTSVTMFRPPDMSRLRKTKAAEKRSCGRMIQIDASGARVAPGCTRYARYAHDKFLCYVLDRTVTRDGLCWRPHAFDT